MATPTTTPKPVEKKEAATAPKKVEAAPVNKSENFKRIAGRRINNILKQMALLENCTTSAYEYTDEQKEKILTSIENALVSLRSKFDRKTKAENKGIVL